MNKTEMARELASRNDWLTQPLAAQLVDSIFNPANGIIADELDAGGKLNLGGFGTFEVRQRAARKGRNPRTGEQIDVPARNYPAFKAAKGFKDRVG